MDLTTLYNRIQETAKTDVLSIDNRSYTTKPVFLIDEPTDKPSVFNLKSLGSLAEMIEAEIGQIKEVPLIVNVRAHNGIEVHTTYDSRFKRAYLYEVYTDIPKPRCIGNYVTQEEFMIELRSQFVKTDDVNYLLNLLASIVDENKVKSTDNGMSQKVEVHQGITTIGEAEVRPIVALTPYRTFLEIEQPQSEFLVRLREGGNIALFEADGGAWKLEAKKRIGDYLREKLSNYTVSGLVVVTE